MNKLMKILLLMVMVVTLKATDIDDDRCDEWYGDFSSVEECAEYYTDVDEEEEDEDED